MDYSFYGGRRGASFVLAKSYPSIREMIADFQKGGTCTVQYDEYVMIDTVDKADADNGKIYRRGYDYSATDGGALYCGQIVGPMGHAPHVTLDTEANVASKYAEVQTQKANGYDLTYNYNEGEYTPTEVVPGKKDDGTFNDDITWKICSVRTDNNQETMAYIGFTFPYDVIDFTVDHRIPYINGTYDSTPTITRTDDKSHPFYEKWNINIPDGKKGDTLKNFRVITAGTSDGVESYEDQSNDRANARKVLVYDYYCYDTKEDGAKKTIYLGDYNMIDSVSLNENGTLTFGYTHDDDKVFTNAIKWIDNVELNEETGHFTINYNYGGDQTKYEADLKWVDGIRLEDNGDVYLTYSHGDDVKLSNTIRWLDNVYMSSTGTVRFDYNDGTSDSYVNRIQWIKDISLTKDGDFRIRYNNETEDYTQHFDWPTKITVDTTGDGDEGDGTQQLTVYYSDGTSEVVGEPINYIMQMVVNPENYHLLVLYSDPTRRAELQAAKKTAVYNDRSDWYDLGPVRSDNGLMIGTNYSPSHFTSTTVSGIINQLNTELPEGFDATDLRHGKTITVGDTDEDKLFFGFDYSTVNNKYIGWYYLGSFGQTTAGVCCGAEDDADTQTLAASLPINSVWFVVED